MRCAFVQVRVDYGFVFRTIMETKSGLVVCGILVAVAVTCSWALHACESGLQYQTRNVIEALWMIIITFTTVRSPAPVSLTHIHTHLCFTSFAILLIPYRYIVHSYDTIHF